MTAPLRVVIDARLIAGKSGGVETVVRGLAQGFAELPAPDLDLTFIGYRGHSDWLRDDLGHASRLVEVAPPSPGQRLAHRGRTAARLVYYRANWTLPTRAALPRDRQVDRLQPDLVHYPFQCVQQPQAPFIYHPHDLQHLHFPEYFSKRAIAWRETGYRAMCTRSALVAVVSSWVKEDVCANYQLDPAKIAVVLLAPPVTAQSADPGAALAGVSLPERYLLYPAANWPHKNHVRLFAALASLAAEGSDIELVLTGPVDPAYPAPAALANAMGVGDRVHALGYLSAEQLDAVYQRARGVVVPTLFEAASFPVWEAFARGIPVAASSVTSLPEQVGEAGLLFDPLDTDAIAAAMQRLWTDDELARRLGEAGRARVAEYSWRRTAQRFGAHYRALAGRVLSDEDRALLVDESF